MTISTSAAEGQEQVQPVQSNVLCKICKAVTNIEQADNDNPFDEPYSGAEESSEESQEEETKDKVEGLQPTKPTVNKDMARA